MNTLPTTNRATPAKVSTPQAKFSKIAEMISDHRGHADIRRRAPRRCADQCEVAGKRHHRFARARYSRVPM